MSFSCQKQPALLNQKDRWTLWTVFNNANNYEWKILIWVLEAWMAQNVIWESIYYLRKVKIVKSIVGLANSTHLIFYLQLRFLSFWKAIFFKELRNNFVITVRDKIETIVTCYFGARFCHTTLISNSLTGKIIKPSAIMKNNLFLWFLNK